MSSALIVVSRLPAHPPNIRQPPCSILSRHIFQEMQAKLGQSHRPPGGLNLAPLVRGILHTASHTLRSTHFAAQ